MDIFDIANMHDRTSGKNSQQFPNRTKLKEWRYKTQVYGAAATVSNLANATGGNSRKPRQAQHVKNRLFILNLIQMATEQTVQQHAGGYQQPTAGTAKSPDTG